MSKAARVDQVHVLSVQLSSTAANAAEQHSSHTSSSGSLPFQTMPVHCVGGKAALGRHLAADGVTLTASSRTAKSVTSMACSTGG